jgi:threonyl-tRNA synthetase
MLAKACEESGQVYKLNPGDGAFYGPKLDFKLRDSLGRIWQCGTIQLDMNLPERFEISYIDEHNEKVRPIMIHRAIYGSLERFIGILIEHFAGAFPTWLAPVQVKILPVKAAVHREYVEEIASMLREHHIRVVIDESEEKLGYRLRKGVIEKVPYLLVIGDQEMQNGTLTYRPFKSEAQVTVAKEGFLAIIKEEIENKSLPETLQNR